MIAAFAVDQLGIDSDAGARLANAALQHMADTELRRDLADVDGLPFECEGSVPSDHTQSGDLRQVGCDVLADPVAEIFLLGVAAHVLERQHANAQFAPVDPSTCLEGLLLRGGSKRPHARHDLAPAGAVGVSVPVAKVGALY